MNYYTAEHGNININTILIDLNGTLSIENQISEETKELVNRLKNLEMNLVILTGDQRGTAAKLAGELGVEFIKCASSEEKAEAAKKYNRENTASIGNTRIDIGMFENSIISIATLQKEGIHAEILKHVDIVTTSIEDALGLFLDQDSFTSAMKV